MDTSSALPTSVFQCLDSPPIRHFRQCLTRWTLPFAFALVCRLFYSLCPYLCPKLSKITKDIFLKKVQSYHSAALIVASNPKPLCELNVVVFLFALQSIEMSKQASNEGGNQKQEPKPIVVQVASLAIPGLPVVIENYQSILTKVGEDPTSKGDKNRYIGHISGELIVPTANFSKQFTVRVPFSSKRKSGIALSFQTGDLSQEKQNLLNQFVFGERKALPIILTKNAAIDITNALIQKVKAFDKLKPYWQKAVEFISENNITINIFIDTTEKKYVAGFFWQEFKIDSLPSEIKIEDVIFGVSLQKTEAKSEFGVMVGGKGSFTTRNKTESNLYVSYSYGSEEQRLQFGASLSVITSLLELIGVQVPQAIVDFTSRNSISVEWIAGTDKKIMDEIKNGEQGGEK